MDILKDYKSDVEAYLKGIEKTWNSPVGLFEPMHYILNLGGKRLRPILVMLGAELVKGKPSDVLPLAAGIEIFHNFTLVHDDIMDEAPTRRGKATVHEKWDLNTGILSGDVMMVQAYEEIAKAPHQMPEVLAFFTQIAREVCVGQQLDMDFEQRQDVGVNEYMEMIRLKTAVLVGGALKMGVLAANGTQAQAQKAYEFGELLGLAFQVQDDWLDLFGKGEDVGKQQGGDILAGKKTILVHEARRKGVEEPLFEEVFGSTLAPEMRVKRAHQVFTDFGVKESVGEIVEQYTHQAFSALNAGGFDEKASQKLQKVGLWLMDRNH